MREVGRPLHEFVTLARTLASTLELDADCSVHNLAEAVQNLAHQLTWSSLGDEDSVGIKSRASQSISAAHKVLSPDLVRMATYRKLFSSYISAPAPPVDLSDLSASPVKVLDDAFKAFCTAGFDGKDATSAAFRKAEMMSRFGVTRDTVVSRLEPVVALWERLHCELLPGPSELRSVMFRASWTAIPFHDAPRAIYAQGILSEERAFFHVSSSEAALLVAEDQYVHLVGRVEPARADVVCALARTLHVEGLALDDIFASHSTAFEAALLASAEPSGLPVSASNSTLFSTSDAHTGIGIASDSDSFTATVSFMVPA
jgi:hypothetical protein